MGVAETLRHRFDKSLNAGVGISHRTGDVEDGDELLDLMASGEISAEDKLIADEERADRIKFLKQFFAVLKQTLTPEEYKFVKLRFTQDKKDRQIAVWLGFPNADWVFRTIREKLRAEEKTIERLCARSPWEGARAFVWAITREERTIVKNKRVLNSPPLQKLGFSAFMRATEHVNRVQEHQAQAGIYRRFYMRGIYHGVKLSPEIDEEIKFYKDLLKNALMELTASIQVYADYTAERLEEFKNEEQTLDVLDLFRFSSRMRERVVKLVDEQEKILCTASKDDFFKKLSERLLAEDMDGNKMYAERCAERRAERGAVQS